MFTWAVSGANIYHINVELFSYFAGFPLPIHFLIQYFLFISHLGVGGGGTSPKIFFWGGGPVHDEKMDQTGSKVLSK